MSPTADDVCPICLCSIYEEFSRPENCQHRFDLECLSEWAKLRLSCPSCRSTFGSVYSYKIIGNKPVLQKVQKMEPPAEVEPFDETNPLDFTVCEICSGGMNEELLLICDQCDKGFHTYCLTPPLDSVPTSEQWFCPQCEEFRITLPSTSHSVASARTIRLLQRTALAERVRRALARNRQLTEDEDDDDDDEDDESDDVDFDTENEEIDKESVGCSEEEVNDFSNDDARVLGDLDSQIYGASSLPSVKRRGKRKKRKIKSSKKTREKKISKRSVKGKQRRKRLKSKRTTKEKNSSTGLKSRRRVPREPVTRLSLLGAELEPVADPLVTENSRRFDQPLIHRKESVIDEKPTVDSCDLLGSIIPEQIKTLAPGRLFAVKGGRFNSTENFEKYKIKKTNQLSLELRERLGITTNTERSSNLETAGKTSMVRHPTDRKESSCLDDKRLAGSVPSEFRKIGDPDGRLKSKGSEIFQRDQHKSVSTVIHQHQHSNNKQQSSDRHSIKRIATDIYRNDVAQNLCESINERKSQAGMSRGSYKYKGTQNLYMDRTKGYDHPHNEFEHSNCSSSKGISRNEESEQEDHGSFLKTLVDGRTTSGLQKNVSMPGCQSTSESNLLVKNNLEVKNNSIFLCENSKQKADDILKIIDGFAKEGIKPYKREITVQDYKDVMRAVVRECYKKRILDETSIKYKVQQHVAAIRESKLQSHERHPSERTDTERSIELALPSKRFKTDK